MDSRTTITDLYGMPELDRAIAGAVKALSSTRINTRYHGGVTPEDVVEYALGRLHVRPPTEGERHTLLMMAKTYL